MGQYGREQNRSATTIVLDSHDLEEAKRLLELLSSAQNGAIGSDRPANSTSEAIGRRASLLDGARRALADRQRRLATFGKAMFGEPAWDILLWLYVLQFGERPTIGRLGELAGTSKSTALRWIDYLESQTWISRASHPTDKRSVFIDLTDSGRAAMELYLTETVAV